MVGGWGGGGVRERERPTNERGGKKDIRASGSVTTHDLFDPNRNRHCAEENAQQ